jgi:hypothetical protein
MISETAYLSRVNYMTSDWQALETMTVVCITAVVEHSLGSTLVSTCTSLHSRLEAAVSKVDTIISNALMQVEQSIEYNLRTRT